MGICTSKPSSPEYNFPNHDAIPTKDSSNLVKDNVNPAKDNDKSAQVKVGKKSPLFSFYSPSPVHYLFDKKSPARIPTNARSNSMPKWFFRVPPLLAKHIKELAYVLTQPCQTLPIEESSFDQVKAINDQIDKWNDDDYFCRNHILSGMTHSFYDKYSKKSKTAKELWDTLKLVYQAEEASTKKFLILNYMDFKMTDDRHISVQVRELQLIANDICVTGMVLDENFHVGAIVAKLPPTWKEYRNKLKHNKKYLALDQLMQHLQIEEETSNHENELAKEIVVKAHVVVDKDEKKNSGRAGSGVLICLYVDDMLIFGTDIDKINEAKNFLTSNFSMKDLGEAD
ncbi:hypothetical protein RJ639_025752, partial [Escallonia herrerae]